MPRHPDLQKCHFELIASTIRELDIPDEYKSEVTHKFARALQPTNAGFDAQRFISWCLR